MVRTKNTVRKSTGGKEPRQLLATKAALHHLKNKNCPYAKKSRVPKNYYKVRVDESTLSGGGGCLANALFTYYVRFYIKQDWMCIYD